MSRYSSYSQYVMYHVMSGDWFFTSPKNQSPLGDGKEGDMPEGEEGFSVPLGAARPAHSVPECPITPPTYHEAARRAVGDEPPHHVPGPRRILRARRSTSSTSAVQPNWSYARGLRARMEEIFARGDNSRRLAKSVPSSTGAGHKRESRDEGLWTRSSARRRILMEETSRNLSLGTMTHPTSHHEWDCDQVFAQVARAESRQINKLPGPRKGGLIRKLGK
jgi:hypothetical protein